MKRISSLFLKCSRMQLSNPDLFIKIYHFFVRKRMFFSLISKIINMLRKILLISIIGLTCFTIPGCLMIGVGGKDSNVRDRVAVIESRLDNLERLYATDTQQQYCQ